MAERHDAHIFEIVVGQSAQQLAVDIVGTEYLGILVEADPAEPTVDVQVQSPGLLSAAVFEKGCVIAPSVIPRGVLEPTLESPCGRRPLDSSIAAPSPDTRP